MRGTVVAILFCSAFAPLAFGQHHEGHPGMGMHPGHMGGMEMHPGMMFHPGHIGMGMYYDAYAHHEMHMYDYRLEQARREHHLHHMEDFGRYLHQKDVRWDRRGFPGDPDGFQRWLKSEEKKRADGKPYDPYYDHYRRYEEDRREEIARRERERDVLRKRLAEEYRRRWGIPEEKVKKEERPARVLLTLQERDVMAGLRLVHARLRRVDRDFGGRRAEAMILISRAIEELGSPSLGSANSLSLGMSPLAQSRKTLQEARDQLVSLGKGLSDRPSAYAAVQQAAQNLDAALSVE
jgi:hypothetical protein